MLDRYKIDPYDEEYWTLDVEEEEDDDYDYITGISGDPYWHRPFLPHVINIGTSGSSGSSGVLDLKSERMRKNFILHNKTGYLKQKKFVPVFKNNTRHK